MNTRFWKRTAAAVAAAVMAVSMMTGCKNNDGNKNDTEESSEAATTSGTTASGANIEDLVTGTRALEEGDDYAINKINNKSPEDALPGGYILIDYNEENQGKLYLGEKSQIIINAYNYKEDLQDMAIWADSACASLKLTNVLRYARDTDFIGPENVKICGFDGIRYDLEMIQYQFVDADGGEDGERVKEEVARFKGRNYFFYSEQDAYVIMFECRAENWDEEVARFEEFVKDLEVTKTEY